MLGWTYLPSRRTAGSQPGHRLRGTTKKQKERVGEDERRDAVFSPASPYSIDGSACISYGMQMEQTPPVPSLENISIQSSTKPTPERRKTKNQSPVRAEGASFLAWPRVPARHLPKPHQLKATAVRYASAQEPQPQPPAQAPEMRRRDDRCSYIGVRARRTRKHVRFRT